MKCKLTAQEKKWVLYDVGNSAFILLVTTIVPIYFNSLAKNGGLDSVQYLAYWGYAASAATLLVALTGPVLGAVSDWRGAAGKNPCSCARRCWASSAAC